MFPVIQSLLTNSLFLSLSNHIVVTVSSVLSRLSKNSFFEKSINLLSIFQNFFDKFEKNLYFLQKCISIVTIAFKGAAYFEPNGVLVDGNKVPVELEG